jgi:hypothetical protein
MTFAIGVVQTEAICAATRVAAAADRLLMNVCRWDLTLSGDYPLARS